MPREFAPQPLMEIATQMGSTRVVLVGTSRSLLKVDLETEEVTVVDDRHGLYYGITWDSESVYVASRWYPPFMPTANIERPRLLRFDQHLKLTSRDKFPAKAGGLHQIIYHDDHLYCSCSRQDYYLVRDANSEWSIWYPSDKREHHNQDTHHFNSIWFHGDRMYLVGHNNGPSDVWELAYPQRELLTKHSIGCYSHNIWLEEDQLAACNSKEGTLETASGRILCRIDGFPRGVIIGDTVNVVGVSDIANRRMRKKMLGRLHVYSKDWQLQKVIPLGRCGQVGEVRCLDSPDLAHNGLPAPVRL